MSEDAVIDVAGLVKRFGDKTAVDHVDIRAPRGAIYGFLGPNGSGKTTTIRLICGLLKADGGSGQCLGYDIRAESESIRARVGYMTQHFSLYVDLTVRENLEFLARLHRMKRPRDAAMAAMRENGLEARADQLAGALSGGWKQRLALAGACMHDPALLLLDEPTAGVDPKARRDFWDRIRALSEAGVTALVSTHYMDEAVQCDRIAFLAEGRKLLDAPTGDVARRVGLVTWKAEARAEGRAGGSVLREAQHALQGEAGVDQIARFGAALHVSGRDGGALGQAIAPWRRREDLVWTEVETGLEEAFIYLMTNDGALTETPAAPEPPGGAAP